MLLEARQREGSDVRSKRAPRENGRAWYKVHVEGLASNSSKDTSFPNRQEANTGAATN